MKEIELPLRAFDLAYHGVLGYALDSYCSYLSSEGEEEFACFGVLLDKDFVYMLFSFELLYCTGFEEFEIFHVGLIV